MKEVLKPFGLRMPPELKELLAERADANGRSINSEIICLLKATLKPDAERSQES